MVDGRLEVVHEDDLAEPCGSELNDSVDVDLECETSARSKKSTSTNSIGT
jgi:hypothetical protein